MNRVSQGIKCFCYSWKQHPWVFLGPASCSLVEDDPGCLFVKGLCTLIADNESIEALLYLE